MKQSKTPKEISHVGRNSIERNPEAYHEGDSIPRRKFSLRGRAVNTSTANKLIKFIAGQRRNYIQTYPQQRYPIRQQLTQQQLNEMVRQRAQEDLRNGLVQRQEQIQQQSLSDGWDILRIGFRKPY